MVSLSIDFNRLLVEVSLDPLYLEAILSFFHHIESCFPFSVDLLTLVSKLYFHVSPSLRDFAYDDRRN